MLGIPCFFELCAVNSVFFYVTAVQTIDPALAHSRAAGHVDWRSSDQELLDPDDRWTLSGISDHAASLYRSIRYLYSQL
jgi:hypothetical protein